MTVSLPDDYDALLKEIKARIRTAQTRAGLAVNRELILLYWEIGNDILKRQQNDGWGAKVIDRLARDLKAAFPEMQGLSSRNLKYMRTFAAAWPDELIVQQLVAQIPWGHNVRLLDKLTDPEARLWYARQTIEQGWSRAILEMQIESRLRERQGKAITNFDRTLPPPQSHLVHQTLKDPYNFDFLTLGEDTHERHLERGLLTHIREFLLEMGAGFAFVGSQYQITVGDQEFYLDLLFYHLKLRSFLVIDLKMRAFEPEDAGKMNFYLAAVDDLLRHPGDAPTVGIILCKTRNATIAEYALRNMSSPIGVATHLTTELTRSLPASLASDLPTVAELEAEARIVPFPEDTDLL